MEGTKPIIETLNTIPGYQIESNIPQLAEQIFSQLPQPAFSIGLELETNDVQQRSPQQAQTIFEVLAHVLLYGIKIKYGEEQDPRRLEPQQIQTITEYMRSIGFNVVLTSFPLDHKMEDPQGYVPTNIEYYRLRMVDDEAKVWHDIKIEPYRPTTSTTSTTSLL